MPATRTGPCRAPLFEFPGLLTPHCCFVREVSNECHNGVVVLDLPVDALVDELVAGVCKRLALVPELKVLLTFIARKYVTIAFRPMICVLGGLTMLSTHFFTILTPFIISCPIKNLRLLS